MSWGGSKTLVPKLLFPILTGIGAIRALCVLISRGASHWGRLCAASDAPRSGDATKFSTSLDETDWGSEAGTFCGLFWGFLAKDIQNSLKSCPEGVSVGSDNFLGLDGALLGPSILKKSNIQIFQIMV